MEKIEKSPLYDEPVLGIIGSSISLEHWDKCQDSWTKKKYKDTVINLLNYLDPSLLKEYGNKDKTEFNIPHGSIMVKITIKDNQFNVHAPFLKLPKDKQNIIMRQISELNFFRLLLAQIKLDKDVLFFNYTTPLELCEPYKIWDVLYDICIFADYYDDIFIEELGAGRVSKMQVKPFTQSQLDTLWDLYQKYLDESLKHLEYFEANRWWIPGLDSARITLMKLDYLLQPQGKLVSDIQKTLNDSFGGMAPNEIFNKTKTEIAKLKKWNRKKFDENMYIPKFLIPPKRRASLSVAQNILRPDYETAKNYHDQSNFFAATHFALYAIYNLFFRNTIPTKVEEVLNSGLKKASHLDWKVASEKLLQVLEKVMKMK
ncbi:MAG: hypothetical protein JW827_02965 [Spirochaetes bacterium]|nr:hypothetical protein [Spirochaetota bacterium]